MATLASVAASEVSTSLSSTTLKRTIGTTPDRRKWTGTAATARYRSQEIMYPLTQPNNTPVGVQCHPPQHWLPLTKIVLQPCYVEQTLI